MEVFVDTSAFLAILNRDDTNFTAALAAWHHVAQHQARLVTTNYILVETLALVQNRFGMEAVRDFEERFRPLLTIIWVDAPLHATAVAALLAANRRRLSLVDCTSFAVCRQRTISQVMAFDDHFREQGFECLA